MSARPWLVGAAPGLLGSAALVSLWAPAPAEREWLVVWALIAGAGFAVAATTVLTVRPSSGPGKTLYAVSMLLLAAPPLSAVRLDRVRHHACARPR